MSEPRDPTEPGLAHREGVRGDVVDKVYRPGHYVHPIHARRAIGDPASFEPVVVKVATPSQIFVGLADGSITGYSCVEAERLTSLVFSNLQAENDREPLMEPFSEGNGVIALLSRRWHMLIVPIGPRGAALPRQIRVPIAFELRDGAIVSTIEGTEGVAFALFNLSENAIGP
jgi:hypothetical protein